MFLPILCDRGETLLGKKENNSEENFLFLIPKTFSQVSFIKVVKHC